MIGPLILGFFVGTIAAAAFLYAGGAIFVALAVYSGVGSATMFGITTLSHFAQNQGGQRIG